MDQQKYASCVASLVLFEVGNAEVNGNCADHDLDDGVPHGFCAKLKQTEYVHQAHGCQQDADHLQGGLGLAGLLQGNPKTNQTDDQFDSCVPGGFSAQLNAGDEGHNAHQDDNNTDYKQYSFFHNDLLLNDKRVSN